MAVHRGILRRPGGFTLVELLVVLLIIGLISVAALPTIVPALNARQVSEAGRILQGALVGARDKAIHDGQPCGVRLLPDPTFLEWTSAGTINPYNVLAYNRVVPIESAPEYNEGRATTVPAAAYADLNAGSGYPIAPDLGIAWPAFKGFNLPPALVLVESAFDPETGAPNAPTSWFWNVRVGDKVQINNAGAWYTVIGPMLVGPAAGNSERFVNAGLPGPIGKQPVPQLTSSTIPSVGTQPVEYLVLVNGKDDNGNGFIDEGFDGVDNNGVDGIDEYQPNSSSTVNGVTVAWDEWETEAWQGSLAGQPAVNATYAIRRRPVPATGAREVALPADMVIDATTGLAGTSTAPAGYPTRERSRLPIDPATGFVDIVINPDGTVVPTTAYSTPASFPMGGEFLHFWLADRSDLNAVKRTGTWPNETPQAWASGAPYYLPIAEPTGGATAATPGPYLKGDYSVLTLAVRTGQMVVNRNPPFVNSAGGYLAVYPFLGAEHGGYGSP